MNVDLVWTDETPDYNKEVGITDYVASVPGGLLPYGAGGKFLCRVFPDGHNGTQLSMVGYCENWCHVRTAETHRPPTAAEIRTAFDIYHQRSTRSASYVPAVADVLDRMHSHSETQDEAVRSLGGQP